MTFEPDAFDDVVQGVIGEVAPDLLDIIGKSLAGTFEVKVITLRTLLVADGGFATVRWAAECVDSSRDGNLRTDRDVLVDGLTLVGPTGPEQLVAHYIDWAGVMGQLGMTTSRPSAIDKSQEADNAKGDGGAAA